MKNKDERKHCLGGLRIRHAIRTLTVTCLPNATSKRHSEPSASSCSVVVSTEDASSGSASPRPGSPRPGSDMAWRGLEGEG